MKKAVALLATALLVIAFVTLCITGAARWFQGIRKAAIAAQITADVATYSAALVSFSNTFGFLPIGSNAVVTSLLTGNNARKLVFIYFPPQQGRINILGEFVDPTGKPYKINVLSNAFQITPQ